MAMAGTGTRVRITTSDSSGSSSDECGGCNSVDAPRPREVLDTTDFSDAANGHSRILGLKDFPINLSGDYEPGNTGQGRLITAAADGSSVWAVVLWDGTAGFRVECKVASFDVSATPAGKVEFKASLVSTAAPTTI